MKPAPYTFPHRSRAAMTDYLLNRRSRGYDHRIFRFCWDVKIWAASYREGWEEERKAERACELDAFVMEMELARPDLAPAYL